MVDTSTQSIERTIPTSGLNRAWPSNRLPIDACPDLLNISLSDGTAKKRPGSKAYANQESGSPTTGLFNVQFSSDLSQNLIKHTNLDFKSWDPGAGAWTTRTPRTTSGTVTITLPNLVDKVQGPGWAASDVRVGDRFFITSGTAGINKGYRVASVTIGGGPSGFGRLTLEPNWVDTAQTAVNYQIDKLFNGGLSSGPTSINPTAGGNANILYSGVVFSDTGALGTYADFYIFSNGNDGIFSWKASPSVQDPTTLLITTLPAGLTTMAARYLEEFASRIFGGFIVENGNNIPQRIRWSVNNNNRDWLNLGSGFNDLVDTPDEITGLKKLGNVLVAYKKNSIFFGVATQISSPPIVFSPRYQNYGCIAPFSIASFGDFHFFIAQDGIYRLSLSSLDRIDESSNIFKEIIGTINYAQISKAFGLANRLTKEYWLAIPKGTDTSNSLVYVYSFKNPQQPFWTKYDIPISYATDFRGGAINIWNQYATGNVNVVNGSTTVNAGNVATNWASSINGQNIVGQIFKVDDNAPVGGTVYTVASFVSASQITITPAWQGLTLNNKTYGISIAGRTWYAQTVKWSEASPQSAPIILWGDNNGNTLQLDPTLLADSGNAINAYLTFRDDYLSSRSSLKTLMRLWITLRFIATFNLQIALSTSQGNNWDQIITKSVTLPVGSVSGSIVDIAVDVILTGLSLTLRILNNTSTDNFEILGVRHEFLTRAPEIAS